MTSNCEAFTAAHHYFDKPVSQEELDFPIAYSILMYKDVEQVSCFCTFLCVIKAMRYTFHVPKYTAGELINSISTYKDIQQVRYI